MIWLYGGRFKRSAEVGHENPSIQLSHALES